MQHDSLLVTVSWCRWKLFMSELPVSPYSMFASFGLVVKKKKKKSLWSLNGVELNWQQSISFCGLDRGKLIYQIMAPLQIDSWMLMNGSQVCAFVLISKVVEIVSCCGLQLANLVEWATAWWTSDLWIKCQDRLKYWSKQGPTLAQSWLKCSYLVWILSPIN